MFTFVYCFDSLSSSPRKLISALSLFIFSTVFGIALASPAMAAPKNPEEAVRAVLDAQMAAWNRGDLETYMTGYWKSPELTFYSGGTVTQGWQPTLERYRKRYQSGGNEMGKLAFAELKITVLRSDSAFVRGGWQLTTASGKNPGGLFTLVVRKFPEGWRIVHDHTSVR